MLSPIRDTDSAVYVICGLFKPLKRILYPKSPVIQNKVVLWYTDLESQQQNIIHTTVCKTLLITATSLIFSFRNPDKPHGGCVVVILTGCLAWYIKFCETITVWQNIHRAVSTSPIKNRKLEGLGFAATVRGSLGSKRLPNSDRHRRLHAFAWEELYPWLHACRFMDCNR